MTGSMNGAALVLILLASGCVSYRREISARFSLDGGSGQMLSLNGTADAGIGVELSSNSSKSLSKEAEQLKEDGQEGEDKPVRLSPYKLEFDMVIKNFRKASESEGEKRANLFKRSVMLYMVITTHKDRRDKNIEDELHKFAEDNDLKWDKVIDDAFKMINAEKYTFNNNHEHRAALTEFQKLSV